MDKSRGLFLVLDGVLSRSGSLDAGDQGRLRLPQGLAGALRDFRALGYRIFGIRLGGEGPLQGLEFDFDEVIVADQGGWAFPEAAWSLSRRYSLNVHGSMLCSRDEGHEGWARDAGLRRFETPAALFGL